MIDFKIIGKRIKKARNAVGFTQEVLSEKIGVSTNYLSKIEGGHEKPNLELLGKISASADVSLSELLTGVVEERQYLQKDPPSREGCDPLSCPWRRFCLRRRHCRPADLDHRF